MKYVIVYGITSLDHETNDLEHAGFLLAIAIGDSNCFPWNERTYNNTKIFINGMEFSPPSNPSVYWLTNPQQQYANTVKMWCRHIEYCTDIYRSFYGNSS